MKYRLRAVALAALAVPATAFADGFEFTPATSYPIEGWVYAVAAGDVDGDGRGDVIVATARFSDMADSHSVLVYRQQADGTLATPIRHYLGQYNNDVTLAVVDFDFDGTSEFVLGHDGGLSVFAADEAGAFSRRDFANASNCWHIAAVDVDLDGVPDIVCQPAYGVATVFRGDRDGQLVAAGTVGAGDVGVEDIAIGDVTGDGYPDLLLSGYSMLVYAHDGVAGFRDTAVSYATESYGLVIGDFNGDGRNDVASSNYANVPDSEITVRVQGTDGELSAPTEFPVDDLSRDLGAADLDGDGGDDLVVAHATDLGRLMHGGGNLQPEILSTGMFVDKLADTLALADVTGDGCVDAVAAPREGVTVMPGNCFDPAEVPSYTLDPAIDVPLDSSVGTTLIGDVNGDGRDDLVLANVYGGAVPGTRILLQSAGGSLGEPIVFATRSDDAILADINGDGVDDVVLNAGRPITAIAWQPGGTFATIVTGETYNSYDRCDDMAAADFDGDGGESVVCYDMFNTAVTIFDPDGAGGFAPKRALGPLGGVLKAAGDFSDDGQPDLLLACSTAEDTNVCILPGDGQGGFGATAGFPHPDAGERLVVGDFNDDGRPDTATVANGRDLIVQLQAPGGGFRAATSTRQAAISMIAAAAYDLDGNGADDLLGFGSIGASVDIFMQYGGALTLGFESHPGDFNGLPAAGDIDGDGCGDVVISTSYQNKLSLLMGRCKAAAPGTRQDTESDFNGDGRSDVPWRNATTGATALWNGAQYAERLPITRVTNLAWRPAGVGDLDGDGLADLVWRQQDSGRNAIWLGGRYAMQQPIATVGDTRWQIQGVGDFDGDGTDDLFWRHATDGHNAVWHGADAGRLQWLARVPATDWTVVGVGDFDGDGTDDLLWRNPATGANTIWRSGRWDEQDNITDITDTDWEIAGVGDFDRDGRDDILWRKRSGGRNVIWRGGQYSDQLAVRGVSDPDWKVVAIGDYDGDLRADILWRHATHGRNVIWAASQASDQRPVRGVTDTDWQVVP